MPTTCSIAATAARSCFTLVDSLPVPLSAEWLHWVEHPLFDHECTTLRTCLNRQVPFGSSDWLAQFTGVAGLDSTLRPRRRPRKTPDK